MACKAACAADAIRAVQDEKGFLYPQVDAARCVDCGACMAQCTFAQPRTEEHSVTTAYAFRIADADVLADSTSGGAFTALAERILDRGGMVAGCVLDERFEALHVLTADKAVRDRMRRSKYVQSNTDGIFSLVTEQLKSGKQVLFVGTPCQAAQMAVCAGRYRENLIVCDFLCHGVPNNAFFKAHIRYLESAYRSKATTYWFRGKKYGWSHMLEEVRLQTGRVRGDKRVQAYSRFFYAGVSLRPSCRRCRYRCETRGSDITLGDFWGIQKLFGKTDNRGYSLVTANTQKGQALVEQLASCGQLTAVDKQAVLERICEPLSACKIDEAAFWELYRTAGYEALVKRYTDTSLKTAVVHRLKKTVKRILSK